MLLLCTSPACGGPEDGTCWTQIVQSDHGDALAFALTLHGDDTLYVVGRADGAPNGGPFANGDAFISKFDTAGANQWTVQFGSPVSDEASAVATDHEGGVYVAGSTRGSVDGMTGGTDSDLFLTKITAEGDRLWTRQFDLGGSEHVQAMTVDGSGRIVVVGYTDLPSSGSTPDRWPFLAKFDAAGQVEWTRQMDGPSPGMAETVTIDPAGDIYVAGAAFATSIVRSDVWASRYTADGTQLWVSSRDAFDGQERARAIAAESEGGARVATWSENGMIHVTRYDALGAEQSTLDILDPSASFVRFVRDDAGELGVHVAGARETAKSNACHQDAAECMGGMSIDSDLYVAMYDLTGQREWFKTSPTGEDEFDQIDDNVYALTTDSRGHVYVAGTREHGTDKLALVAGFCPP